MIKRLQVISTSGNVTRSQSYLLSFKLPPCMICSKLPCLTSLQLCTYFSHHLFVHTLRGSLVCIMLVSCDEDTNYITRTSTPAAPEAPRTSTPAALEAPQAPSTPLGAPLAQTSFPPPGPITRARARELNYIMLLKNEGPEA
jgi:hypothetical protein